MPVFATLAAAPVTAYVTLLDFGRETFPQFFGAPSRATSSSAGRRSPAWLVT
jgi:hypothetical protein